MVAFGPGLQETGVQVQQMTEFTVDAKKAGKAQLDIICHDADGNPVKVDVKDNKDGTYTCKYKPLKNVKHVVLISYGGVNIPKSPFRVSSLVLVDFCVCVYSQPRWRQVPAFHVTD